MLISISIHDVSWANPKICHLKCQNGLSQTATHCVGNCGAMVFYSTGCSANTWIADIKWNYKHLNTEYLMRFVVLNKQISYNLTLYSKCMA